MALGEGLVAVVVPLFHLVHLEWVNSIHTLEGLKAFKRDLGGACDELEEKSLLLLVVALEDLE